MFVYEVPSSAPDTLYLPAGSSGRWLLVGFGCTLGDTDKVGLKICRVEPPAMANRVLLLSNIKSIYFWNRYEMVYK